MRRCRGAAPYQRAWRRDPGIRPISGNVRGDLSQGSEHCFLIWLAARLLKPAVLHERERPTGNKHVSGLLPANLRVNPMKRGRREHGLKPPAGKQRILKPGVHKFHLASTCQVLPGQRHEARAGFECCDAQAPGGKAARQLPAPTPDLKHMITAPDPCDQTSLADELVRISRTAAVVLRRHLIKNPAVTTCSRFWQPCIHRPPFMPVTATATSWPRPSSGARSPPTRPQAATSWPADAGLGWRSHHAVTARRAAPDAAAANRTIGNQRRWRSHDPAACHVSQP